MTRFAPLVRMALAGAFVAPALSAVAAPKPGDRVPMPDGFGSGKARGAEVRVVYSRTVGERKHGVDRKITEQICSSARQMDASIPQPVFEDGWDKPASVVVERFENARWRAEFSTTTGYACSNAADLPRTKLAQPCGCIFKNTVSRHTLIREVADGRVENINVDHQARTVRRSSLPGRPDSVGADRGAELAARLAPAVTGSETIAGLACEVRRQDMPGGGWQEWCITPNDAKLIPDVRLRARSLRHAQYAPTGGGTQILSDRTVDLVADVLIDESFFGVPADYAAAPAGPKGRP